MSKIRCPKGEQIWVSYKRTDGTTIAILTSKPPGDYYFLYEVSENGELNKLGKSKSPGELEEKFNIRSKMKGA